MAVRRNLMTVLLARCIININGKAVKCLFRNTIDEDKMMIDQHFEVLDFNHHYLVSIK